MVGKLNKNGVQAFSIYEHCGEDDMDSTAIALIGNHMWEVYYDAYGYCYSIENMHKNAQFVNIEAIVGQNGKIEPCEWAERLIESIRKNGAFDETCDEITVGTRYYEDPSAIGYRWNNFDVNFGQIMSRSGSSALVKTEDNVYVIKINTKIYSSYSNCMVNLAIWLDEDVRSNIVYNYSLTEEKKMERLSELDDIINEVDPSGSHVFIPEYDSDDTDDEDTHSEF